MPKIPSLPAGTTLAADDEFPAEDTSASTTKRWTMTRLKEWLQSLTGWITNAMLTDSTIRAGKTTFNSDVTSFTNSGTAGGTFYYINLGGIKILWGRTNTWASGGSRTIVYPTSFFSATPHVVTNIAGAAGTAGAVSVPESPTSSGITVNLLAYTGSGTMAINFFAIGS